MKYYWLCEQRIKNCFNFQWKKLTDNLADYHTKYFPTTYHKNIHSKYILLTSSNSHGGIS